MCVCVCVGGGGGGGGGRGGDKGDAPGWALISVASLDILPTHIDGRSPASNKAVTLDMHGRPCYS